MKKTLSSLFNFALLFLFFIQMAGTLVSSIYTLDLLHTSLDAKVLGLLLFFTPVIFLFIRKQPPRWLTWVAFGILFITRSITPYLDTNGRMLISGLGTGACICLFVLLISSRNSEDGKWIGSGLALAVGLSTMLRTVNSGLDYSLTISGSWSGWILGLILGWSLLGLDPAPTRQLTNSGKGKVAGPLLGFVLVLTLVYFIFSAPAVIVRWTEGNYAAIVLSVSVLSLGWIVLSIARPDWINKLSNRFLILWNLFFSAALVGTILANRVNFPTSLEAPATVVGTPTWIHFIPLVIMLLLFPVLFLDMQIFWVKMQHAEPNPAQSAAGMLLGSFVLVLLVFMNIFTNVWGYVEPISPFFRNKFWLPFFLIEVILLMLVIFNRWEGTEKGTNSGQLRSWIFQLVLAGIFIFTVLGVYQSSKLPATAGSAGSLKVMTYNIQQANDDRGEQSFMRQLELIRQVSPDILAIQEGDSTRISLNNNDYVRYYADQLGYYSYYGPTTVTGSYGTAILSRYPLKNRHSVFTYSDQDENGIAEAQFEVDGRTFNIYNIHPDGTDAAKTACIQTVLNRSANKPNVIVLGDFNLRGYEPAYQLIDQVYTNAWMSVYPTGISSDGVDMSGDDRIDHIFVSKDLRVKDPVYLKPPLTATDHPVHWVTISWGK